MVTQTRLLVNRKCNTVPYYLLFHQAPRLNKGMSHSGLSFCFKWTKSDHDIVARATFHLRATCEAASGFYYPAFATESPSDLCGPLMIKIWMQNEKERWTSWGRSAQQREVGKQKMWGFSAIKVWVIYFNAPKKTNMSSRALPFTEEE